MKTRPVLSTAAALACVCALLALPAGSRAAQGFPLPFEESGGFSRLDSAGPRAEAEATLAHARNLRRLGTTEGPRAATARYGDVVTIADNGRFVIPPQPAKPFDLGPPSGLSFTPAGGRFAVTRTAGAIEPVAGGELPLGDDDTEEVPLGFSFPFLGQSYSSVFVNSDGNLTFGEGAPFDSRDAADMIAGPPRLAPLFADLDVTSGGSIHAERHPDRLVVTWRGVPEFGTGNVNTMQVTLRLSGVIEYAYERIDAEFGVVGVSEGRNADPIHELDLSADLPAQLEAGAIFEEFRPAITRSGLDIHEVAREFYRGHPDKYDFLVTFADFDASPGSPVFASTRLAGNATSGIGSPVDDLTARFGSQGELEAFVHMGDISKYWPDARKLVDPPFANFLLSPRYGSVFGPPGRQTRRSRLMGTRPGSGSYTFGVQSPMSVLSHEVLHRWLGGPLGLRHPETGIGPDSFDLLSTDQVHWSFFLNTAVPENQFGGDPRHSAIGGNNILDLGTSPSCPGTGRHRFRTAPHELTDGASELDQYLMGLRTEDEVGPLWYVDDPTTSTGVSIETARDSQAVEDIVFCGRRVDFTVDDIQAFPGTGPRVPALGDEDDDGRGKDVKTMAFVLLSRGGAAPPAALVRQVDEFRAAFERYGNGPHSGGRGRFDTSIDPAVF